MGLLYIELVTAIVVIAIIIKFKLNQKFVLWLLKGNKLYLPPTDNDCKILEEMKQGRTKYGDAIVRMCDIKEYMDQVNDENLAESDIVVFFYLTSFFNLFNIEFQKVLKLITLFYAQINENLENNFNNTNFYNDNIIDLTNLTNFSQQNTVYKSAKNLFYNSINVGTSFTFITVSYIVYMNYKNIFKKGYKNYEAKIFYLIFTFAFIISFSLLYYFDNIVNFDHDQICEVINNRMGSIYEQSYKYASNNNLSHSFRINLCNKNVLKSFYAFIFSVLLALLYRSSIRLSTFDNLLIEANEKLENTNNLNKINNPISPHIENTDTKRIKLICQVKQILNTFLLLLLIDPLFKNVLIENKILNEVSFPFIILLPIILLEFILNLITMKYYSALFLNQNYYEMLDFSKNFDKRNIQLVRTKMNYINTKFWEYFMQFFNLMFMGLIIFIFYINRSNIISGFNLENVGKIENNNDENNTNNTNNLKFKTNFLEVLMYFLLIAITFAKAIFGNIYTYYIKNFNTEKKVLFI